jgi:hypothetical protein
MFKTFKEIPPDYKIETNGYYWRYTIRGYSSISDYKAKYRWKACRDAWKHFKKREKYRIKQERENINWHEETDGPAVFKDLIKKHYDHGGGISGRLT